MGGYITWIAIACMLILAAVDLYNGQTDAASKKIIEALGAFGLGRKVEKTATKISEIQATGEVTQQKVDSVQVTADQSQITVEETQKTAEKISDMQGEVKPAGKAPVTLK